jgi:acetyl esterase/lipase
MIIPKTMSHENNVAPKMDNRLVGAGKLLGALLLVFVTKKGVEGTPTYRKARMVVLLLGVALRVGTRRLVSGPRLPSWTYKVELLTEVMRDSVQRSGEKKLDEAKIPKARKIVERFVTPLSRTAKHFKISIPNTEILAEWIAPVPKEEGDIPTEDFAQSFVPPLISYYLDSGLPVVLYLHGGGYISMSTVTHRSWIGKIAVSSNAVALALNYRLAPEHPFPSGLIDALYSYRWLVLPKSAGGLGVDSSKIIIAGDSAGGGLSLATVLSLMHGLKDPIYSPFTYYPKEVAERNPLPTPFDLNLPLPRLVVLLSPWTDLECKGKSWSENAQYCYLVPEPIVCEWYAGHHQVSDPQSKIPLNHPLLSPLNANFSNFPEVLLQVGEKETLYDDSALLAQRMKEAGVNVNFEVYSDMVHVFQMFGKIVSESSVALSSIARTIYNSQSKEDTLREQQLNVLAKL